MYLRLSSFRGHTLFAFTGLLEYSRFTYKIYVKMQNRHQTNPSAASLGKADEIFYEESSLIIAMYFS